MKKILSVLLLTVSLIHGKAQTSPEMDAYRKAFDIIIYNGTPEKERFEKIKKEIPPIFFEQKGFYVLTKAMEFRSIPFLEFVLSQKGVSIATDADYTHENIFAYLPWDNFRTVKPGTCIFTDTLLDIRKNLTTFLIKKGANLNHTDANGSSIMQMAIYKKDLDFLKFLYEANQNKFTTPGTDNLLYTASYIGCIDFTVWLIEHGMDVNTPNKNEGSAIGAAVNHPEIVAYLIKKGANVNLANGYGWTPLMYAANYGNMESLKLLLEAGADITAKNQNGGDVFQVAKEYKKKDILKYLKGLK